MRRALGWSQIEKEAEGAFRGRGKLPLRAYSEFMPPPQVGIKPYRTWRDPEIALGENELAISEYEQVQELTPGLARIAEHVIVELEKLTRGEPHGLSRTLLQDNPAWPAELVEAAKDGRLRDPVCIVMPLALSRTQDDKGNARWTLLGASDEGPSASFWESYADGDGRDRFSRFLAWAGAGTIEEIHVLANPSEVPAWLQDRLLVGAPDGVKTLVALRPFGQLPAAVRKAYLARTLRLVPSPASFVFYEHPHYKRLAGEIPGATQIPLLHVFPRCEGGYAIRIPQSGWLDEAGGADGHRVVARVARTHRWERVPRDQALHERESYDDEVSVALFSTAEGDLGLYGKPMARNVQIWNDRYVRVLDGPRAGRRDIELAAKIVQGGGRYGYRFVFPPMRAGTRELVWHRPLVARRDASHALSIFDDAPPLGFISASPVEATSTGPRVYLAPRLLSRRGHREAAALFPHEHGRQKWTTTHNARKLLEARDLLGDKLSPALARALLHASKDTTLDDWLEALADVATDEAGGALLGGLLLECVGEPTQVGPARTFDRTSTRTFEEHVWRTISSLCEGEFRQKENADGVRSNEGRTGGPAAAAANVTTDTRRDLDKLADHLHARYRVMAKKHGMDESAKSYDHAFRWETDFDYPWSLGWSKNQTGELRERNVVFVIPGKNRGEAVIMADHYDTAYMEDVYEKDKGGDGLRAAASGADDNHSATTALLSAADVLLPMSKAGKLARDVWLVHLTGEEFPADSLGARALVQELIEERLTLTTPDGATFDASKVKVVGAYILDMIGHNTERDRDVFQIAPGEGPASARLASYAHVANERWNEAATKWNEKPLRKGMTRAKRMKDGKEVPPEFQHLALRGEIRTEWEPRSALYNTDGQVFSDYGVPVVLFMENYDISRTGYHDTLDTMANIDLDYCAALTAIAIETVAEVACRPEV
jgi:Peptidase family M28